MSSDYKLPLMAVRPDCQGVMREVDSSNIPSAPPLPYSNHTPPHFMENNNKEKYLKLGKSNFSFMQ